MKRTNRKKARPETRRQYAHPNRHREQGICPHLSASERLGVLIQLSLHGDVALEAADRRPRVAGALKAYKGGDHRGMIVR